MSDRRPLELRIARVIVHAQSGADARRLADGLPGALERALRSEAGELAGGCRPGPAERAARQIADVVFAKAGSSQ